jgi:hypothetical protein
VTSGAVFGKQATQSADHAHCSLHGSEEKGYT